MITISNNELKEEYRGDRTVFFGRTSSLNYFNIREILSKSDEERYGETAILRVDGVSSSIVCQGNPVLPILDEWKAKRLTESELVQRIKETMCNQGARK